MNQLIAIAIAIGLALASAAKADGASCNQQCSADQTQCTSRLGVAATANCSDGFRVCVQRCDPRRMNTAYLESDAARRTLLRREQPASGQVCASRCALSARSCVEGGNGRNHCRSAQMACEDRCGTG